MNIEYANRTQTKTIVEKGRTSRVYEKNLTILLHHRSMLVTENNNVRTIMVHLRKYHWPFVGNPYCMTI